LASVAHLIQDNHRLTNVDETRYHFKNGYTFFTVSVILVAWCLGGESVFRLFHRLEARPGEQPIQAFQNPALFRSETLLILRAGQELFPFLRRQSAQLAKRPHDLLALVRFELTPLGENGARLLSLLRRKVFEDFLPLPQPLFLFRRQSVPAAQILPDHGLPSGGEALEPLVIREDSFLFRRGEVAQALHETRRMLVLVRHRTHPRPLLPHAPTTLRPVHAAASPSLTESQSGPQENGYKDARHSPGTMGTNFHVTLN
jgi:hypothetical protein